MVNKTKQYGYPIAVSLLISSPVIWLFGADWYAWRIGLTGVYLLILLKLYARWSHPNV